MAQALKSTFRVVLALAIVASVSYGWMGLWTYVLPMYHGNLRAAMASPIANEVEVLLTGAQREYDAGNYAVAKKVLEQAAEKLIDKNGRFHAADKKRVEQMHFLLGKCYQRLKKADKAISEYEDTLRLNPDHYDAKYNLEMLKRPGGGGGGNDGEGGGGDQTDPGKKKPKI